jgi:hypothetical protein
MHGFVDTIRQCAKEQLGTGCRQAMCGFNKLPNVGCKARTHFNVLCGVQLVVLIE